MKRILLTWELELNLGHQILEAFTQDNAFILQADVCFTYGAEGTMMRFLLAGVPQIVAPHHVEAHIAARRLEQQKLAQVIRRVNSVAEVVDTAHCALHSATARAFAECHQHFNADGVSDELTTMVESKLYQQISTLRHGGTAVTI